MARKPSEYVEVSGPLFEPDVVRRVKRAIGKGVEEVGEESAGVMMGFIAARFMDTGAFMRSVESDFRQSGDNIGYAKVAPTAAWPEPGRPTKTWAETGQRGGKRLRKGAYIMRNTATRVRIFDLPKRFAKYIQEAIG
jgi:hypothetical protein